MSELKVSGSDIYLQNQIVFEKRKKYLLKANSGHGKSSILNFIYDCNKNYSDYYKAQLCDKDYSKTQLDPANIDEFYQNLLNHQILQDVIH